jgi:RNA polymerase sigma-70 factor (ECF subfamily)
MNDFDVADFERERGRLVGLGYRMLGSIADAEDLVQETYLRWQRSDRTAIREPSAWLSTTMTRLCIDTLRARASRRETYVGPWLPEPVQTAAPDQDSAEHALELADDLSVAFLLLLERLGPEERAAFLLHDVFEASYPDIARTLDKSDVAVRQMVSRARGRLGEERPRYNATHAARRDLAERFRDAVLASDAAALLALFKPDATLISDGGGKALAALRPIYSAEKIVRFFVGVARKQNFTDFGFEPGWINDAPGFVMRTPDGAVFATMALEVDDGRIAALYLTRNPDKLARIH